MDAAELNHLADRAEAGEAEAAQRLLEHAIDSFARAGDHLCAAAVDLAALANACTRDTASADLIDGTVNAACHVADFALRVRRTLEPIRDIRLKLRNAQ